LSCSQVGSDVLHAIGIVAEVADTSVARVACDTANALAARRVSGAASVIVVDVHLPRLVEE
jgi:hypothetical protein